MKVIHRMRRDICKAIESYVKRFANPQDVPLSRKQDITNIYKLLDLKNAVELRLKLLRYITDMPRGLEIFIPFLEVNQLKYSIKKVLDLPNYQEIEILKSLLFERNNCDVSFNLNSINNDNIQIRLTVLENKTMRQDKQINKLNQEIQRLVRENEFLCQEIQVLADKNKVYKSENLKLHSELKNFHSEYQKLTLQHKNLMVENEQLKKQLAALRQRFVHVPGKNNNGKHFKSDYKSHPSILVELSDNQKLRRRHTIF